MLQRYAILIILTAVAGCAGKEISLSDEFALYRPAIVSVGSTADSSAAKLEKPVWPINLSEAIRIALANNPDIAAADHMTTAAGAGLDAARGARYPRVGIVGSYMHHLDDQRLVPANYNGERGVFGSDIASTDIVLSLPLYTGGRITNEIRAAELRNIAADYRLAHTKDELIFNVTSVFFHILAQRQMVESLEFSISTLERHRRNVDALIAEGKAAIVDRLRTEVRLADLDQRLVREQNILDVQGRLLANLLGFEETAGMVEARGNLDTEPLDFERDLENCVKQAFANRSDYHAAQSALRAQMRTVDVARAASKPTVSLQGAYGGRWSVDPTDRPSGSDSLEDVGRVGIAIEIPIFDRTRIGTRARQQEALLAAQWERLRKFELQIRLDVQTALLNIKSASQRITATEKAIEQASESLRIEQQKYELGRGTITDVLDAQSALLNSQTNHYRALADYQISIAQLRLATGGR